METKHTPGPWVADGSETTTATWVNGPDGKRICTIKPSFSDWDNARLIAAAPELLEALQALVADLKPYMGQGRMDDKIRNAIAAIAKATGG